MWSSVLGLAFLMSLDPVRLGVVLLMISRPRPVQSLFAYWIGCLIVSVPALLVPLMLLHVTPGVASFTQGLATNSTVRHIQIGIGVLALSIAALIAVRFSARQRAHLPTAGDNTSAPVVDDPNTPTAISRLGRAQDAATEGRSAIRWRSSRLRNAWENGSSWVAVLIGIGTIPPVDGVLFIGAIIVASGAAIGTQVSAAIAFVVGMLAVIEIILVSYLATPAKTQVVLRLLHDWAQAHRRQIVVAIFAVVGVALVVNGMRGVRTGG